MPRLRSLVDFRWSSSGDLVIDSDGDLKDTAKENYQGAIQRLEARLQSSRGDWKFSPTLGASLSRFAGKPNTADVGAEVQQAVLSELMRGGFLSPREVTVHVFPLSVSQLAVVVDVAPAGERETLRILVGYDLTDNKISVRN